MTRILILHALLGTGHLHAANALAAAFAGYADVETEVNGLMTYDREIVKPDAEQIAAAHRKLFEPPPYASLEEALTRPTATARRRAPRRT
jgi:UDP-N-acetylglucosamine:LPS N-acetylglucosamine transferase